MTANDASVRANCCPMLLSHDIDLVVDLLALLDKYRGFAIGTSSNWDDRICNRDSGIHRNDGK